MCRLTSEEIKKIIHRGIDKNGRITPGFLKNALTDRGLKQNDAESIAQLINTDISKYKKNQGGSDLPIHDDTIENILILINPPNQFENRPPPGEKKYLTRKKRLMTRIVENLKIQGDLSLAAKK